MKATESTYTILYADDDPDFRLLAQYAFEEARLGAELRFAEDGAELMDYLKERGKFQWTLCPSPDLILLDLSISKRAGEEIVEEIRGDHSLSHISIVALTTSDVQEEIYRSSQVRVDGFVSKPLTAAGLRAMLQALQESESQPGSKTESAGT